MLIFLLNLSLKRLRRNPLRSLLSIVQVALGAFALMAALAVLQASNVPSRFASTFVVQASLTKRTSDNTSREWISLFEAKGLAALQDASPSVESLSRYELGGFTDIQSNGRRFRLRSSSQAGPEFARVAGLDFVQGGFFTQHPQAVISQTVAAALYADAPALGQTLRVRSFVALREKFVNYTVVGVYRDLAPANDPAPWNFPAIFSPLESTGNTSALLFKAKPGQLEAAKNQLRRAVSDEYANNANFVRIKRSLEFSTLDTDRTESVGSDYNKQLFALLSLVVLLVCSISIFSIQMVQISELTHEIGLQKALGASSRQVVGESLVGSLLLAAMGCGLAWVLCVFIFPRMDVALSGFFRNGHFVLTPAVAAAGLGGVAVLAVVFGLYPALVASRLRPSEALKEVA